MSLLLLLITPQGLRAQRLDLPVGINTRVHVRSASPIHGVLLESHSRGIELVREGSLDTLLVPWDSVITVAGFVQSSRLANAGRGFVIAATVGAGVGAAVGYISNRCRGSSNDCGIGRGQSAFILGAVLGVAGGLAGGLIGAVVPRRHRWVEVFP